MKTILRPLGSPAMIVACAALIVALGGVSYAAGVLPKGSVGTAQLQKKAVTASKLRANSVNGTKVKDGTLTATDFKAGQLRAGPQGAQGLKGDKGDTGAPGSAAAYAAISSSGTLLTAKNIDSANITHPAPGVYCIGGLDFEVGNAVATMQAASTEDTRDRNAQVLLAAPNSSPFGCAPSDRLRVQVVDLGLLGATPAGLVNGYFYLWLED